MMADSLDRIAPVARDLVGRVDATLLGLGAPAEHPIWDLVRKLGATPGEVVDFFAAADPEPLRSAGAALRAVAEQVGSTVAAEGVAWHGRAGESFATQLAAARAYLGGDLAGETADTLAGRLAATASFVEEVADWYVRSRDWLAGALADVLTSAQAVTLRTGGPTAAMATGPVLDAGPRGPSAGAVAAAADIGARLLAITAEAYATGQRLVAAWDELLGELPYCAPAAAGAAAADSTVRLRH